MACSGTSPEFGHPALKPTRRTHRRYGRRIIELPFTHDLLQFSSRRCGRAQRCNDTVTESTQSTLLACSPRMSPVLESCGTGDGLEGIMEKIAGRKRHAALNDVATNGDIEIEFIAGKLGSYAGSSR
jgi:hypothetical protein